jgi:hypothetical protein
MREESNELDGCQYLDRFDIEEGAMGTRGAHSEVQ